MKDQGSTKRRLSHKSARQRQRGGNIVRRADDGLEQAIEEPKRRLEGHIDEVARANQQLKQEIEERRRAEEELKRTKDYLQNVIENSVDAIGIVDRSGRFILWNRRAAEIYGYDSDELAGKVYYDLYADGDELDRMLNRLHRDGLVREYEILKKKKDGSVVPMDISISLLKDKHGETMGSVCVARDLSERKKVEMELRRAKDELSRYSSDLEMQVKRRTKQIVGILKYTPAVVYIKDSEGKYTLVNSRYEELFGISNEQIRGKTDYDIFSKEVAEELALNDQKVLATKTTIQVEECIPLYDKVRTYLSVKFPLHYEDGTSMRVCGISTDITELKKTQDQLRRLSGNIMASQEKERSLIARELHDELGQVLTALRMDSVWLLQRLKDKDPNGAERASMMCDLIDKTISEVRGIARRLRPSVLDDLGLIPALEWYTNDFEKRTGIACILRQRHVPKVRDIVATAAYRIAQEALTNVARHSLATHVEVTLQAERGMLALAIADDGRGFDTLELEKTERLGILGMRERASLAGGALEVQSRPGKGTQVSCLLPLVGKKGALH